MNHSDLTPAATLEQLHRVRLGWIIDNSPYARDLAQAVIKLGNPVELDKFAHSIYFTIETYGYTFLARREAVDWDPYSNSWNMRLSLFVMPAGAGEFWQRAGDLLVNMVFTNNILDDTADRVFIPGAWQDIAETIFTQHQDNEKAEAATAQETERQRLLKQLQVGKSL